MERSPVGQRPFNLRLWFAIGSFGTIAVIYILSAWWLSSFLTRSLLERENQVSQEFMESIVAVEGSDIFHDDGSEPVNPHPNLLEFAQHITSMPGVVRVNIHASTHRILWSTEEQLIGKVFAVNKELDRAFNGQAVTEVESLDEDTKPEHIALGQSGHLIEAYIPIRSAGQGGAVVGVVEFYKVPAALQKTIDRGRRTVWTAASVAAIILFLTLYWIVQRGARVIERQQQHMAQMEAFSAIGQMASAVAHSLRNPMSAIRSSAELWGSQAPPQDRVITDEVIREVDRMDGYVRDLLAYARTEPYQLQAVNPLIVINRIISKQRATIERNQVDVETVDSRVQLVDVLADDMLLEQALTSVMTNAIEAMPGGGKLGVSISRYAAEDDVRIEIADTGRGIPADILQRVTESYFSTKARGLGLGLMLAKGIIEGFRGKLEIASTPNVGTTVFISLKSA